MSGVETKPKPVNLILFGPSQVGKSSYVNTISGKDLALVGVGDRESTTQEIKTYPVSDELLVTDTMGLDDSKLQISNQEIRRKIA